METHVSLRTFAKMVDFSPSAVGKAIERGTIKKGVVMDGSNIAGVIPSIAAKEWGKEIFEDIPALIDDEDQSTRDYADGIPDDTSKSEADRLIALYKAKVARLNFLETEGLLVDKGLVYSRLFDFAAEIRDTLMNVPDRCIDAILAADGRNQALILLGNEIAAALIALSKTDELEILPRR
jgi:hypothetical protein